LMSSARAKGLPTTAVGVLALLTALIVLPLALAPRADAFLYWVDARRDTIGRANLDGTGIDKRFIRGYVPSAVAVDARHIYWAGLELGVEPHSELWAIGRARLDGKKVDRRFIPLYAPASSESIQQVAVDDDHIYWAENLIQKPPGFSFARSIGRAMLDGSGVNHDFIAGWTFPRGLITDIAVDATHIYWCESPAFGPGSAGALGRANLDGTGTARAFIPFPSGTEPVAVAVDAAHIYWSNGANIGRANVDGTGVDHSFISELRAGRVRDLAVGAGHIYWAGGHGRIGRADLDGSGIDRRLITGVKGLSRIAVNRGGGPHRDRR
jgi:hypothetical protein